MIKLMKMINDPSVCVARLAREHPEWLPVLEAAIAVAASAESHGGEFAGAWVVDELARRSGRRWVPNLRILVSYGFIEKSGPSTRGGRRAYYRMLDRPGVERALKAHRVDGGPRRALRFIGAGASADAPADAARRAGEIAYEPRSWR
jgi:hypothetical protein